MSTIRQINYIGGMRLDISDFRSLESSICYDFDVLAGGVMAGSRPLVVTGFTIDTTGTVGNQADLLQLTTASGIILHPGASESGTIFRVPASQAAETLSATNSKVVGSFASGTTNYVGLDLRRTADATTTDTARFYDADTGLEISQTVPKARTLSYRIIITTQTFSTSQNVLPIAKIVTDSDNNVVSVTDARNMAFRLGSGGDTPDPLAAFTWADATRHENGITFSSGSSASPFEGGDKEIGSLKSWMDSVMYRMWELGGGEFWYSTALRDNLKLIYGPLVSLTDNFVWTSGTNTLQWESLAVAFENSTAYFNTISDGSAVLDANGKCLYVDVDRASSVSPLTAVVGVLETLGVPTTPGSRFIIAWRVNNKIHTRDRAYEVGRVITAPATTINLGSVRLSGVADDVDHPRVVTHDDSSSLAIAAGMTRDGHYALGSGAILIGTGTNDASITLSKASATTTVAGYLALNSGALGTPGLTFTGDTDTGIYRSGANTAALVAGGVKILEWNSGGLNLYFGALVTQGASNTNAITSTGNGTGTGVVGNGGATDGIGVVGNAGGNGHGVAGYSTGSGSTHGVHGESVNDTGVHGQSTNSRGGFFTGGSNTLAALEGVGSGTNNAGVKGTGGGTGGGGLFTGGASGGPGVVVTPTATNRGAVELAGTNPPVTTGLANSIVKLNTPKAWGLVGISGGAASLDVTTTHGFNVATATASGGTDVLITFPAAGVLTGTDYLIHFEVTVDPNGLGFIPQPMCFTKSGSGFTVKFRKSSDGTVVGLGALGDTGFSFIVYGSQ